MGGDGANTGVLKDVQPCDRDQHTRGIRGIGFICLGARQKQTTPLVCFAHRFVQTDIGWMKAKLGIQRLGARIGPKDVQCDTS